MAGTVSAGLPEGLVPTAYAFGCGVWSGASDSAHFVNSRDSGQAVPLVTATFSPTRQPILSMFVVGVRTVVQTATGYTGLVTFIESS